MHELKITGDTPEALYMNVVNTLAMFLRGPAQTTPPVEDEQAKSELDPVREQIHNYKPGDIADIAPVKPKRGKKAVDTDTPLNDPLPDVLAGPKTIEHDATEKPALTAADITARLQAIQAADVKRGLTMPECVSHILKLYGPFGITNAKQLKPESYAEFLEASEAYLAGED